MLPLEEILSFKITNFNRVAALSGGFLSLFGLVSYLFKEKFYLGEALVSTIAGVIVSPHAWNLIRPLEYTNGDTIVLEAVTLYFTRMVLGVQLVIAGIQLPSKYLKTEWRSLALLLGPGMCAMWISTGLIVWALVPNIPFIYALAVGSCVTPTDPILSNSIVKGKFADKNIPKELQKIIIAESGANDGLGFPFLFLALYLIRYTHDGGLGQNGGSGKAMAYWFGITWGYEIILSVIYGVVVGWAFKVALRWAEKRRYVDRESFLVFAVSLALFIVGTLGMIGSDDVLACFIAGNAFTWDDWFRLETQDDSFQPTIDMLLNVGIFTWYGAVCPWYSFAHNNVIPLYRLVFIGVLVLLFRRLPIVLAMHKKIRHIEDWRQALFVGYFGPIGVSAIFYLYTSREYLRKIRYHGHVREDAETLKEIFDVVVWFMVICSIIGHGLSIPLGKLGLWLPRTMSRALSSENTSRDRGRNNKNRDDNDEPILPFRVQPNPAHVNLVPDERDDVEQGLHRRKQQADGSDGSSDKSEGVQQPLETEQANRGRQVFKIGGTVIKSPAHSPEIEEPRNHQARSDSSDSRHGTAQSSTPGTTTTNLRHAGISLLQDQDQATPISERSIRFNSSPDRDRKKR